MFASARIQIHSSRSSNPFFTSAMISGWCLRACSALKTRPVAATRQRPHRLVVRMSRRGRQPRFDSWCGHAPWLRFGLPGSWFTRRGRRANCQRGNAAIEVASAPRVRFAQVAWARALVRSHGCSGPVAQWIRHRPTEPGIAGSSPAGVISATKRRRPCMSSSFPGLH